jgi:hypothetical protein
MRASRESGGSALSQFSQVGLSSSIRSHFQWRLTLRLRSTVRERCERGRVSFSSRLLGGLPHLPSYSRESLIAIKKNHHSSFHYFDRTFVGRDLCPMG